MMRRLPRVFIAVFLLAGIFRGCSSESESEESGTKYKPGDSFDEVRAGTRMLLSYDAKSNSFTGTVKNTTAEVLRQVRVEVHLSNGTELGPTTPTDVAPGVTISIKLAATSVPFEWWSAHAEVGNEEEEGHGGCGGDDDDEHGQNAMAAAANAQR
jgi:hypothetical protein